MNTTKTKLAAVGGIAAVAVLAAGYFTWSAYSAKTAALEGDDEGNDGLETVQAKAETLSRKSAIFPCRESVLAVQSNEAAVVAWKDEAMRLASRGDRVFKPMTASELKSFLESDAKRLQALPGGVMLPGNPNTVMIRPTFDFGPFKDYIVDGKMPQDDAKKIAELRRQWDDLATIAEALSECGVVELTGVQLQKAKAEEEQQPKGKRKKPAKVKAEKKVEPAANAYVFTFTARPAGFVKTLNALETCERFVVVDDFSFVREADAIAVALGGETAKAEEQQTARGRRGRRRGVVQAQEQEKKDGPQGNVITDPQIDAPMKVDMSVTVYDFRSMEEGEGSK